MVCLQAGIAAMLPSRLRLVAALIFQSYYDEAHGPLSLADMTLMEELDQVNTMEAGNQLTLTETMLCFASPRSSAACCDMRSSPHSTDDEVVFAGVRLVVVGIGRLKCGSPFASP